MPQLAPLFSRMMLVKVKATKSLLRWMPVFNDVWRTGAKLERTITTAQLTGNDRVDHTDMRVRGWVGSVDLNDVHALVMLIWSMRSDRRDRYSTVCLWSGAG